MNASHSLDAILRSLDLPLQSRKIYRELLTTGEATARMLSERLSLTRPSTYDHLSLLKKRGLIVEKEIDNKAYFAIADLHTPSALLEEKIDSLHEKKKEFDTMLPSLLSAVRTETPTVKFFEGKLGLTHLLNDILWHENRHVYTMWPYERMLEVLGKETLVRFNERRLREGVRIHTLWPSESDMQRDYIWSGHDEHTERRKAPRGVTWSMGYTIYGNRVSFISSKKEVFGFIVSSEEFAALMRVQFDALWRESKPYRTTKDSTPKKRHFA